MLLAVFLAAELNPFYLKVGVISIQMAHILTDLNEMISCRFQSLLWMEPDHPFVIARLAGVFLCALPAGRELYQYINDPRYGTSISLFQYYASLSESSDFFFTRSCALQESSENGATRLVIARYDGYRVARHR
jgi:phosphatidylserine synthase 2